MRNLLLIFILFNPFSRTIAQFNFQTYFDFGESAVSECVYLKNIYRSAYQHQKYKLVAGVQFDLISKNPNTLSGMDFLVSRACLIKEFPFETKGFFMLNRYSDLMYETNWGAAVETRKFKHWFLELGTNFKTYTINSVARETYNLDKSTSKLHENFNLIYTIRCYIKPTDTNWNVGLSLTNIDYYVINQSTNPLFNLQSYYKANSKLTVFLEAWYKQAGIFNINANYFGYFFRGGISWEL